ncbi:MAG: tRNA sulfurtransferase, partial [Methermicoccaceae archaeon]
GLPYGTQGKVVSLFSGGIDSAVASWMMMKRGAEIVALYCDNAPFTDETTRNRAREGVKVLSRWSPSKPIRLYEVPTGDALSMISKKGDKFTCVLCKRMMYRLAAKVMELEGCNGVVTGSSLGQVASQTLKNLMAEVKGLDIPLYHPLIGMDKQEVVELARKIETYEVSIKEATPCSAVPLKPSIDASPMHILELERELGMDTLIKSAIRDAVVLDVTPQSQF